MLMLGSTVGEAETEGEGEIETDVEGVGSGLSVRVVNHQTPPPRTNITKIDKIEFLFIPLEIIRAVHRSVVVELASTLINDFA